MVIAGIGPTLITLFVILIVFPTWGSVVYPEVFDFPDWAQKEISNSTMNPMATVISPMNGT